MAMSKILAKNLGKSKPSNNKVVSEFTDKVSPASAKPRNGADGRRKKGDK